MIMKENIQINGDAIELRKHFGQDIESPIDIFSMLENQDDLTVVFQPMGDSISGICVRDKKNKIIAINSEMTHGRQRFTVAHELCHLFFHTDLNSVVCPKRLDTKDEKEIEANKFASYFLAPYNSLRNFIQNRLGKCRGSLDVNDVVRIEQFYGLSRQATLWRLVNEWYIKREVMETMQFDVIKSAVRLGYDNALYRPSPEDRKYFTLGKYVRLAEELKEKDIISTGMYEEYLLDAFRSDIVYGLSEENEESCD